VLEGPSRTLAAAIAKVKVKVKVKGESGEGSVAMGSGEREQHRGNMGTAPGSVRRATEDINAVLISPHLLDLLTSRVPRILVFRSARLCKPPCRSSSVAHQGSRVMRAPRMTPSLL